MQQPDPTISDTAEQKYFVIPLSIQKDGDCYLVGNVEMGDFFQFPLVGLQILQMLQSGTNTASIKSRLATEHQDVVDVDDFVAQLTDIGFIHPEWDRAAAEARLKQMTKHVRRTFDVDPQVAGAIFSLPTGLLYAAIFVYSIYVIITHPDLRINFDAFYIETNRTAFLLTLMVLSLLQVAMHESGHMLAAARYGIKSRYGVGHRLWSVVAESDLTGIMALPKSQRYLPMLAGVLVDILCVSLLTILLGLLFSHAASAFTTRVCQALILEIIIGIAWQFNIFVKTDIYFVLCNHFSYPDLDSAARVYLRDLTWRATRGLFGSRATVLHPRNLIVLRLFSLIWLFGRLMSLFILCGIFLPTMIQYLISAVGMLRGPSTSVWVAIDTISYVAVTLSMLGVGVYMWLSQKYLVLNKGETNR